MEGTPKDFLLMRSTHTHNKLYYLFLRSGYIPPGYLSNFALKTFHQVHQLTCRLQRLWKRFPNTTLVPEQIGNNLPVNKQAVFLSKQFFL